MVNVFDIKTNNWQMSLNGLGTVVEDVADIAQCIGIILSTPKGADPLRPEFGSDIYKFIDRPVNVAAPGIVREILDSVAIWETRARIVSINYEYQVEKIIFNIHIQLNTGDSLERIAFELSTSTGTGTITTRGFSSGFSLGFS